jgi:hypothetical protein|nr:MAG TPA: hypothetical protein [Caudoviricetes sp.]
MRNLEKGQHIFIAFQNGKAILDSQLRPRIYTSLENADRWTPTVNKGKIEYVEYAPTLPQPSNEPLTLEELLEMDGKAAFAPEINCWVLVTKNPFVPLFTFPDGEKCSAHDWYEQVGPVYRRPPEGEEDT